MVQFIKTFTNVGLIGHEITIEADSSKALPAIDIIGLPDTTIKEAKERMRGTFRNCGIEVPRRKFILNLAPSDIKKNGTWFDLPMTLALLIYMTETKIYHEESLTSWLFFWELGLDGSIKRINGLLPSVLSAKKQGRQEFFIPEENSFELEYIPDIIVHPLKHFNELIEYFVKGGEIQTLTTGKDLEELGEDASFEIDFQQIRGQIFAKRALALAAAWFHNALLVGAPGSGKTMMSKAMKSILPPLTFDEILEVSQIYSVVWKLNKEMPLVIQRPFRQIHHTASRFSIIGGGTQLTPGEVSLAHKGILFFDELTEFPRETLEVLRQPLEERVVNISRVSGSVQYPANFMFIASMNPCKCGYYKDKEKQCTCSLSDVKRYQSRISWPLLDRIDIILEVLREKIDTILEDQSWESSESLGKKVISAWNFQQERFKGLNIHANAHMTAKEIQDLIHLDSQCKDFLSQAANALNLSGRVVHRTIKLARTIADMNGQENILVQHLSEAIQYRSKTMFIDEE